MVFSSLSDDTFNQGLIAMALAVEWDIKSNNCGLSFGVQHPTNS